MADSPRVLTEKAARQLSNTTKTPPQWRGTTPRWLTQMIPWTPVEAGVYRVNQALDDDFAAKCSPAPGEPLPVAFSDYDPQPREYVLTSVTTTIEVDTRRCTSRRLRVSRRALATSPTRLAWAPRLIG